MSLCRTLERAGELTELDLRSAAAQLTLRPRHAYRSIATPFIISDPSWRSCEFPRSSLSLLVRPAQSQLLRRPFPTALALSPNADGLT